MGNNSTIAPKGSRTKMSNQNEVIQGDPQPTTNSYEPLAVAEADCDLASLQIVSSECAENLFHAAVEEGDYTKVGDLLKLGADVNSVNPLSIEGFSPLHRAVKKKHHEMAKLLISAKANVNALDKMKMSPLFYSIENEDFELTQLLLNNGAKVKVISTLMLSPMHIATTNKGCSVAELLIEFKADLDGLDMIGRTPLFLSVAKANHEMTQLLLRNGAKAEDLNKLLHLAASQKSIETIEVLLHHGADVNAQDESGKTLMHLAVFKESEEFPVRESAIVWVQTRIVDSALPPSIFKEPLQLVNLLLKYNADVNLADRNGIIPLHITALHGDIEISTMLLSEGANVNARSRDGNTPLQLAVENCREKVAKLLLESGALVDCVVSGQTPLHLAVNKGHMEIIDTLLKFGACVNVKTISGDSLLLLAVKYGNRMRCTNNMFGGCSLEVAGERGRLEILETLLNHGACVNANSESSDSPLHEAVISGHEQVVKLLLERGAQVDSFDHYGQNSLHLAVQKGHSKIVDVLLTFATDANAMVNSTNKEGLTPLLLSAENGSPEITTMLLSRGAKVNFKAKNGESPLHVAVRNRQEEVVKVLLENGAEVNREGGPGLLHLASEWRSSLVDALLTYGVRVNCFEGGKTALHMSSNLGDAKTVATLLEHGANVKIKCNRSYTPLNYAWGIFHTTAFREEYNQNRRKARPHPHRDTIDLLYRHQVKLEAVGFRNSGCSAKIRREEGLDGFYSDCKLEITRMKSEFIGDSNVSYYDILSKDSSFVANFMKSRSVEPTSELEDCKSKFPIYAGIIGSKIRKGWVRGKLLEKASHVFHRIIDWPEDCTDKVFDFLENDDLRVLAEV